jgi:regulator of protease activity HflC (stomatin/prohibitin superfamily)
MPPKVGAVSPKRLAGYVLLGAAGLALLVIGWKSFAVVKTGHIGVVSVYGAVQKETLPSGLSFKPFWTTVIQVNTQLQPFHEKATGSSKDLQVVTTEVTLQYSLVGEMAPEMYENIGVDKETELVPDILRPAVQESVKAVTALYTAEELITQRQKVKVEVEDAIKKFIKATLKAKASPGGIDVGNMAITDFKFSEEFNKAIEAKVRTAQQAQQAMNAAKKTVTEAEAKAEAVKRAADAEAFNIRQTAIARAQAIELEGEQLRKNPQVIQLRYTERWDGRLPTYLAGQQPLPFLDDVVSAKRAQGRVEK